jgi:trehalose synthase
MIADRRKRDRNWQLEVQEMSAGAPINEVATLGSHRIEDYAALIGPQVVDRILAKAAAVQSLRTEHISSTFYGGGVAEILTPLTLLMNAMGIEAGWTLIQGTPDFFGCTKKIHNALQGAPIALSKAEWAIYQQVVSENAMRIHLADRDAVIVHDPQPLALIPGTAERRGRWIWQCHVDLSCPDEQTWAYLRQFVDQYDAAVLSLRAYARDTLAPHHFIPPAINPFSPKNRPLSETEIDACLSRYMVPTDLPLVVQVSRFDKWKDPAGVLEAFRQARREVDCTLVLVGNHAVDDPEGGVILETIHSSVDERVLVIVADDPMLVNALQRRAAVVLQKSIREGFGLTVTEAMWKGAAVVGGNVGGIRHQIVHGENGLLVDSIPEAAEAIVRLVRDPDLRRELGTNAIESVRGNYLMSRLAEDWVDLLTHLR